MTWVSTTALQHGIHSWFSVKYQPYFYLMIAFSCVKLLMMQTPLFLLLPRHFTLVRRLLLWRSYRKCDGISHQVSGAIFFKSNQPDMDIFCNIWSADQFLILRGGIAQTDHQHTSCAVQHGSTACNPSRRGSAIMSFTNLIFTVQLLYCEAFLFIVHQL